MKEVSPFIIDYKSDEYSDFNNSNSPPPLKDLDISQFHRNKSTALQNVTTNNIEYVGF